MKGDPTCGVHGMNRPRAQRLPSSTHGLTILVFPPVWVPIVPHLALPVLSAYLKKKGLPVMALDANVEFFADYLFDENTLKEHLGRAKEEGWRGGGSRRGLRPSDGGAQRDMPWDRICRPQDLTNIIKGEETFFNPESIIWAIKGLHEIMEVLDGIYMPARISFNYYKRGDIWKEEDLLRVCEDERRNIFLPFWKKKVLPLIHELRPLCVGISISSVHQFVASMTLARLIKKEAPWVHIVIGGKHLSRIEHKLLRHDFFFRDYLHSAVIEDGEVALATLIECLEKGESPRGIPGVITWENGGPRYTPPTVAPPLESLPPPDFSFVNWHKYLIPRPYAPLRMSKGCYWGKCTFCIRRGGEIFESLSAERVVDEIERLNSTYGVRDLTVNDDCMPPAYWKELSEKVLKRGLDISMLVWAKPVDGFTGRILQQMAMAGVRQVRWGIESAHPRILRLMRKGTTLEVTKRVLKDSRRAGIWNHGCFIVGFPTETREEAQSTFDFIESHRDLIHSFILYPFILYEQTYIFRNPTEFAIQKLTKRETPFFDLIEYDTSSGMSPKEASLLAKEAKERLLGREPRPLWHHLRLREYLQLYIDRYGLDKVLRSRVEPQVGPSARIKGPGRG